MKLLFMGDEYPCASVVKDEAAGTVRAYDSQGAAVFEARKVTDFSLFALEGGGWSLEAPAAIGLPLLTGLAGSATLEAQGGLLHLLCNLSGRVNAGNCLLVLPEGCRPAGDRTVPAAVPGTTGATVTICAADGVVRSNVAGAGCCFVDSFRALEKYNIS